MNQVMLKNNCTLQTLPQSPAVVAERSSVYQIQVDIL